jgi:plastocyanin
VPLETVPAAPAPEVPPPPLQPEQPEQPLPPAPQPEQPETPQAAKKSKLPLIIGIIVVLIIAVVAIFILIQPKSQTSLTATPTTVQQIVATATATAPQGEVVEVIYANDMFDPATVTVKKGDTVKFVNQGASQAKIESDPHPTHLDNPDLNLGLLDIGKSLSVIMNKVGTWKYHNDLNTTERGEIIVTE